MLELLEHLERLERQQIGEDLELEARADQRPGSQHAERFGGQRVPLDPLRLTDARLLAADHGLGVAPAHGREQVGRRLLRLAVKHQQQR
ncbi:hypothetical protein [Nannocystis pusilla]|uniref:Uncharacterized protein n=1 Tax=Nannocystis pusilla TaxID=889268 RepID=A0ABS7TKV5_9BACT|nr:hypothetical protein [Nannocystis pusilla]MBZ5708836.1 hypothetical protein [Nannocystis pusilla]